MEKFIFYLFACFLTLPSVAQVTSKDTVYLLLDKKDPLIKRVIERTAPSGEFYGVYHLYSEEAIAEKDSLIKVNAIPADGFCEYYYFDTFDKGKLVNHNYLKSKIIYSRRDLIEKGLYTDHFVGVEQNGKNFIVRKLYFSACE